MGFSAYAGEKPLGLNMSASMAQPQSSVRPSDDSSSHGQKPSHDTTAGSATSSQAHEQRLSDALAALAALGYHGVTAEDLAKLRPPDEYEEELQVMAEVRAYFQVAYKVRPISSHDVNQF